jgi:phosphosulfolactate synthase (CoM biosynthesis protein A)
MSQKRPELLIPASSLEVLKTAVMFGADAVYIGGEAFGLRAKAKNFSMEDMKKGVEFAHAHGVKVHVTVNILAHNDDLPGVEEYLKELKEVGPDALIIADPGVFELAKEICPEIQRHVSTQANNTNYATYQFWWKQGASRVVSARELSLREIKEIRERIPAEMETVIDSIKETQSGQTTEETTAGTEETAEVSTQTEPTEGQSEIQGSEWVQFTTEDHEGSSDPEDKTRSYTYYYPTVTVTIPGNETVQMKIQKELDEYVDSFVEGIENGEFGTLYEDMPVYEQSYEDLTFRVIRADDKVISLSWGLEGYDQGAHGWYTLYYMNYYTQTGERITFDSLGSGFRDKALELVTAKAAEMQAKEDCFFNDYEKSIKLVVLDGTEDLNAIYQEIYGPDIAGTDNGPADPTFYITEDGFVFESGQYVLQSYAVGIVDFEIPAADFGDDLTADIF